MIGQVNGRGFVSRGGIVKAQLVGIGQGHRDGDGKRPGVAFFSVGTDVSEPYRHAGLRFGLPNYLVEALEPAVEVIRAVLGRERVGLAVKCEAALGNAVSHPPNSAAEIRVPLQVLLKVVETQHDVPKHTPAVRHVQFGDNRAVASSGRSGDPMFISWISDRPRTAPEPKHQRRSRPSPGSAPKDCGARVPGRPNSSVAWPLAPQTVP